MIENTINLTADWQRFNGALTEHLMALGEHLSGLVNEYAPPVILRGSFGVRIAPLANDIEIEAGTPLPYGEYVELGTKPHCAPIEPLEMWVDTHQLDRIERFIKFGFTTRASRKVNLKKPHIRKNRLISPREAQIRRIAHAIQAAIAKRGTRPQFFMQKALTEMGLVAELVYDILGAHYIIDMVGYLQGKIDMIARESGFAK